MSYDENDAIYEQAEYDLYLQNLQNFKEENLRDSFAKCGKDIMKFERTLCLAIDLYDKNFMAHHYCILFRL